MSTTDEHVDEGIASWTLSPLVDGSVKSPFLGSLATHKKS